MLRVVGQIDIGNFLELRSVFEKVIGAGKSTITVDMQSVPAIDSTGIALMLQTSTNLRDKGGDLILFGLSSALKRLFSVLKVAQQMKVYETETEAIRACT